MRTKEYLPAMLFGFAMVLFGPFMSLATLHDVDDVPDSGIVLVIAAPWQDAAQLVLSAGGRLIGPQTTSFITLAVDDAEPQTGDRDAGRAQVAVSAGPAPRRAGSGRYSVGQGYAGQNEAGQYGLGRATSKTLIGTFAERVHQAGAWAILDGALIAALCG